MAFQSFVSESYIKTFTPILANVDISEVTPFLSEVELITTREILGRLLYDDVKAKFIAQTLNADEIELVDLLKRAISYRAIADAILFLSMKITAKGIQKLSGENSEAVSTSDMKMLKSELENKAEYFEERVVQYLCKNSNKFPLYGNADNVEGIISTSETRYDSDIFLDDAPLRVNRYLYGPNQNTHNA
jgi:hypothetical protein